MCHLENCRVYAQNLLSDTAEDVTALVTLSGRRLTIPGDLMLTIGAPEDPARGIPAMVMQLF